MDKIQNNFNFWQDHSVHYLEMAFQTEHQEKIECPDGFGRKTGECGDTVEMYLLVNAGYIEYVSFQVYGCRNTNACANTVAHIATGKKVIDAWEISVEQVVDFLETLPDDHVHCAELAIGAFYLALADYPHTDRELP